ncbi:NEDD8-specific protease 1 isoform X2 [Cornus florida]|uniref:NEDD8-specific protease 1 isoform X2 n=1 Tax=Cornus florida TaxID=4283 RepID=UPI002898932D|nr:NEDD8-specific protease 1 isoform X2 [Cornus florida]XP_059635081.1 NEDD8-specific protease 1 isoform X2 [Cornus florida]XP_059635082.1 NEDD8-specific protease 1 isoform X2 [Cornus florida]
MRKCAADEKILSYNDVVLRRSDLDILSGPHFLNDRIIEFYFSHLSSCHPSEDILLVPPSIAFWLTNCPAIESLKDFVEPLGLSAKKLVIFPVNNNDDVTKAGGGCHWSLLAFWRETNIFVHHDSYEGMNKRPAKQLYTVVAGYMGTSNTASGASYLEDSNTPQQVNGYDCGLYVAAIARAICHWYVTSGPKDEESLWFFALNEQVTPSAVTGMRHEILGLIKSLMAIE